MRRAIKRRNAFGDIFRSRVTYHRDVAKERKERKSEAMADRREALALRKIKLAERQMEAAEAKLEAAEKKAGAGRMTEAQFQKTRESLQKEVDKKGALARALFDEVRAYGRNPSWGFGIYQGTGFTTEQIAHFKSKEAAETYARSHGLRGYRIRRSFAKNPGCAQTRKAKVSDRAKRYRANQPGCKPAGLKRCKICRSRRFLTVDHIDGNEANGSKRNLRWLCKSCNTRLGAEMARSGVGQRTDQYNPGAETTAQYARAVSIHESHYVPGRGRVGAHDEGGAIIHDTPKSKRREFASDIWAARKAHGNPRNPALEFSTEYHLGYNLGQADRQSANLRKTLDELHATFAANFPPESLASWESFETAYAAGYSGQMGAAAPASDNPQLPRIMQARDGLWYMYQPAGKDIVGNWTWKPSGPGFKTKKQAQKATGGTTAGNPRGQVSRGSSRNNPEPAGDGSKEYQQALRTAELFHGRPVKEQIEVEEKIRTHDWYVSIGPLIKLIIKPLTKKPKKKVPLPFHQSEAGQVQLFCSPDGLQFYLRGGDQELDLDAFGMGQGSKWFRDHMKIGEAVEITYRDRKKFHSFKLTDYFHKLGEETGDKPTLVYDSLSKKLGIIGGAYRIEMEDLVDGMSPGIVN